MRVIYYSYPFFSECDFPLIKALQDNGIDVHYFMPLPMNFQRSSILEFNKPVSKMGLIKAGGILEMQKGYKDCLDLNRLYFIQGFPQVWYWLPSWLLWIRVLLFMNSLKADIVHIDWQFKNPFERFLFRFLIGKKRIMTVHDPIMHSGQPNAKVEELFRVKVFQWADHFILLNRSQAPEFMKAYSIGNERVSFSSLVNYNSISSITPTPSGVEGKYILFFGSIIPYKGLEFLLEAMLIVHNSSPNLRLVIAGSGNLYFDVSKYDKCDYIEWRHRYIGVSELAGLLKDSLFVICPYKDATQSGVVHTAFSMGVPVIASNVGTLPEDIIDGKNGLLVQPCDVEGLANAIISLSNNEDLLSKMRDEINKESKCDNKNQIIAEEYINVYEDLLK